MAHWTAQLDYYEVLELARDADQEAIAQSYQQLAFKHHPDASKVHDTMEKFKEVSEAYAVLSDPEKRRRYDALGFAGVSSYSYEDLFSELDSGSLFGDSGGLDFGSDFLGRIFGRRRSPAGPRKGSNIEVELKVPLTCIFKGGRETVRCMHLVGCSSCEGTGAKKGTSPRECDVCHGTGKHIDSRQQERVNVQQITLCPQCQGRGRLIDHPCSECNGRGELETEEALEVMIPAGTPEGHALRIAGRGHPSPDATGIPGDLFVVVNTLPDERFERRGAHLWHVEAIDVPVAVLGTKLNVPTIDGQATVTVPPGTQSESVLRLQGQGLPRYGSVERGNLYIIIRVDIPKRLNPKQRSLYKRLRTLNQQARRLTHGQSDVSRSS